MKENEEYEKLPTLKESALYTPAGCQLADATVKEQNA